MFDLVGVAYAFILRDSQHFYVSVLRFPKFPGFHHSKFRFLQKHVRGPDRFEHTQNPTTFIEKSIIFKNMFVLIGFALAFILRVSQHFDFFNFQIPNIFKNPQL